MNKKFRSIVFLILLIFMLISMLGFASCSSEKSGVSPHSLSEDKINEIEDAYNEKFVFSSDSHSLRGLYPYLGNYKGFDIFVNFGNLFIIDIKNIGGEVFYYPSSFNLHAYKNGELLFLEEVFDQGKLDIDDIKAISIRFKNYMYIYNAARSDQYRKIEKKKSNNADIPLLNDDYSTSKLLNAWEERFESKPSHNLIYYGTFDGCDVFYLNGMAQTFTEKWFGEELFYFFPENRIYAYKDNKMFTVEEAFERGILSEENIANISYYNALYFIYSGNKFSKITK